MHGDPKLSAFLRQIEESLRSPTDQVRGQAMYDLLCRARQEPQLHVAALPIFEQAIESERVPWSLSSAAAGIELIAGEQAALEAWRSLLHRSDENIVAYAVIAMTKQIHVPLLLDLLARRPEPLIRVNVVSMLGRSGDPAALPVILAELNNPAVRAHAVAALGNVGDARAIPVLGQYLNDRTDAWPVDNHGPMMSIGDVAAESIQQLRDKPRGNGADEAIVAGMRRSTFTTARDGWSSPPTKQTITGRSVNPFTLIPRRVWSYLPLAAAAFELIWIVIVFAIQPTNRSAAGRTPEELQRVAILASFPVATGLVVGVLAIVRGWTKGSIDRVAAVLGILGCGAFLISLIREYLQYQH